MSLKAAKQTKKLVPAVAIGGVQEKMAERSMQPLRTLVPQAPCNRDEPGGSIASLVATMLTDLAGATTVPYSEKETSFPGNATNELPAANE